MIYALFTLTFKVLEKFWLKTAFCSPKILKSSQIVIASLWTCSNINTCSNTIIILIIVWFYLANDILLHITILLLTGAQLLNFCSEDVKLLKSEYCIDFWVLNYPFLYTLVILCIFWSCCYSMLKDWVIPIIILQNNKNNEIATNFKRIIKKKLKE